ncbi:hypothetical protein AQUCO_01300003v1 [Aquilegia coerulea]|uniref:Late embryogenesis abundant protein LEA-2 subgroup domain-containing protein n=1 Tax=Aquilegia coerulea TaxID=218851 RepID=A0A2G5DZ59_AQUCA|nr:hypothetical protein AQUCO_01300003v1 [Aquilegia coerulea]
MSEFIVKSPKHCAKQGFNLNNWLNHKKLWYALFTFLISLVSLIFLVYLLLHPAKPEFYLREANLYQLNLSSAAAAGDDQDQDQYQYHHLLMIKSSVQITLVSKNPNQKVGVYYDQLQLYASYKGQQITMEASLPPFYQGHQDNNILNALLNAGSKGLPVASSFGYEVSRDQMEAGTLILSVKVNGRLRWKVGTWVSSRYHFNVDCVIVMAFPPAANSSLLVSASSGPLSSTKVTHCSTDV